MTRKGVTKNYVRQALVGLAAFLAFSAALAQDSFDSDNDGFDDNSDNCTLTYNPDQRDTDNDGYGNICDPDFNNDSVINFEDLGILRSKFFTNDADTDLNGDGGVNIIDMGITKSRFFDAPGPTGAHPDIPSCTCYFSGDCAAGQFCDWGPFSFAVEDNCWWRTPKPTGVGTGCSTEYEGPYGPFCDGLCVSGLAGSTIGLENHDLVAQTIGIWGDAMINPSAAGGDPVDAGLAAQASSVPFSGVDVPPMLGRHAADALAMAAGEPFHEYFCHWESHPDDGDPPVVNLKGDTCRITSAQLTIQALAAEIQTPGSAASIMQGIVDVCPNWQQMFATQCDAGPDALNCAIDFIESQAYFLRTPPQATQESSQSLWDMLRAPH